MVRNRRRRRLRSVYLACAAILGAYWLLYWALTSKRPTRAVPETVPVADRVDSVPVRPAAVGRPPRAIYPYSVIRGGAYSVGELNAALRADPVAAAHYAVFDRTHMRIARAPESAAFYVSYRQGDRIYWTRRKVRLAAEEALLTDGVHSARARCGNRISLTPPDAAQAGEPDLDLDIPEPPPTARPDAPAGPPSDVFSLPLVVHEIFPSLLGGWLPGGSVAPPADILGGPGGMSFPISHLQSPPPGFTLPVLPQVTPAPPMPTVLPIDFTTLPLPPGGPGSLWIQPTLLPGGFEPGSATGPPLRGTAPAPPTLSGLPTFPGIAPVPGITASPGSTTGPNVQGGLPPPPSASGSALPPATGSDARPDVLLAPDLLPAPNGPPPGADEIPEPASLALLMCGVVFLAWRRLSGRRLN